MAKGTLFLRHKSGCRWPLWTCETPIEAKLVCGAPTRPGSVYCDACRLLAFQSRGNGEAWSLRSGKHVVFRG